MSKVVATPVFPAPGVTAPTQSPTYSLNSSTQLVSFQATVTGTGAVTATVLVQVTLDGNLLTAATITLSGTTTASDGVAVRIPWGSYAVNVSAITGTGATCQVSMGAP